MNINMKKLNTELSLPYLHKQLTLCLQYYEPIFSLTGLVPRYTFVLLSATYFTTDLPFEKVTKPQLWLNIHARFFCVNVLPWPNCDYRKQVQCILQRVPCNVINTSPMWLMHFICKVIPTTKENKKPWNDAILNLCKI